MRKFLIFITLGIILFVSCSSNTYDLSQLGQPTPIAENESAIETMSHIYKEFLELEKPTLKEIKFHKEDSRKKIVDVVHMTTEKLPSYFQYILNEDACEFIRRHTTAEILATLYPMVMDPKHGGEVAVLITGIVSNYRYRNHEYGRHVSQLSKEISRYMYNTGYKSPSEKGNWDRTKALNFYSVDRKNVFQKVGAAYDRYFGKTKRPELADQIIAYKKTLDYQIVNLQNDNHYYELYNKHDYEFKRANNLDDWLEQNPAPPMQDVDNHEKMISEYGTDFVILGLYPTRLKAGYIANILGLDKYWAIIYNYGSKKLGEYASKEDKTRCYDDWINFEKTYKIELREKIYRIAIRNYTSD